MTKVALILVDIQNDYFPTWKDAKWPLVGTEAAASQAAKLLNFFRDHNLPIVHVRHEATANVPFFLPGTEGAQIHASVAPIKDEPVVVKHHINSFRETSLKQILDNQQVTDLVIIGAMSQTCIDHTVRAAADFGYKCSVAEDACAARDLIHNGETIPAKHVHYAFMAALAFPYARIESTDKLIESLAKTLDAIKTAETGLGFNSSLKQFTIFKQTEEAVNAAESTAEEESASKPSLS